jgi:hypothetical protein
VAQLVLARDQRLDVVLDGLVGIGHGRLHGSVA